MDAQAGRGSRQADQQRVKWAEQLRSACETLSYAPKHLIRTISVTDVFAGAVEEARWIEALSRRLAEEYGLQALVELGDVFITIRFLRDDETAGT